MARIYISYNEKDGDIARGLSSLLKQHGHEISIDTESLSPGANWRAALMDALRQSNVFIAILTKNAIESQYMASEVGAARAYAQAAGEMLVIPVVADDMAVPPYVSDLFAIMAPDRDVAKIALEVERALEVFTAQLAAKEKQRAEQKEQLESKATEYVEATLKRLQGGESHNRLRATLWYWLGFLALCFGIAFGFWSLRDVVGNQSREAVDQAVRGAEAAGVALSVQWLIFARALLKAAVIIGLLIAVTKYCFTLGKAFMSEALKSADRIHAISYGLFYLRAFGIHADPQQIKEVFRHWNIDRPSAFSAISTDEFDPKYAEVIVELAKAINKAENR